MKKRIFFFIVLLVTAIVFSYLMTKEQFSKNELPIIQPTELKPELVDPSKLNVGIGHRIGDFSFLNQYNEEITLKDVTGKVFVAEYFFTSCGTICPKMTEQMTRIQKKFMGNENVKILSFTVDPKYDIPSVLFEYAQKHKAQKNQWHFLTGEKKELYDLARKSFFVLKPAEAINLGDANSDFIHTNNFVLVDQKLRIRGYYDGTSITEVNTLIADITSLLND